MKETINVSIAGMSFILDSECYFYLTNYLQQADRSLTGNTRKGEIIADLETRIAEQILTLQGTDRPVSMDVLRPIIEQLDGVQPMQGNPASNCSTPPPPFPPYIQPSISKRLYRNPDGAKIAGICSGLGTYLNINASLLRIVFLIPFFVTALTTIWTNFFFCHFHNFTFSLNGTAILVYIILWIAIPRAQTPRQRLEMQGDNITFDSLTAQNNSVTPQSKNSDGTLTRVLTTILKVMAIIIGCSIFITAIIGVIAASAHLSIEMADGGWNPITESLAVIGISYFWATIIAMAIVMLPVIGLCWLILSSVINSRRNTGWVMGIIFGIWFLIVISSLVIIAVNIGEISTIFHNASQIDTNIGVDFY